MPDSPLLPPVDALIPVVYLLAVVWIGWRVGRGTGDTAQLFLAGRSLGFGVIGLSLFCLLYTSPSPRDLSTSRMPSSA